MKDAPTRFVADGFIIRSYRQGDGEEMARAVRESYDHLRQWMPWATPDQKAIDSEAYAALCIQNYRAMSDFALGIWKGNRMVGASGFHLRWGPLDWKVGEIGMWIAAEEAGSGLGTAALRAMLKWGFTEWDWHRLVWRLDADNVASERVAQKCGLVQEAFLREDRVNCAGVRTSTKIYAILKSDWEALNS